MRNAISKPPQILGPSLLLLLYFLPCTSQNKISWFQKTPCIKLCIKSLVTLFFSVRATHSSPRKDYWSKLKLMTVYVNAATTTGANSWNGCLQQCRETLLSELKWNICNNVAHTPCSHITLFWFTYSTQLLVHDKWQSFRWCHCMFSSVGLLFKQN